MTETPATPPPASPFALPVLLSLVFLSLVGFGVVIPLLPFYAALFDAPAWQITLLFATFSAGQFIGELTWGRLSDKIGRRPVLLITMAASAVGYVALAWAPDIWTAVALRGAMGFFSGNVSAIQGYIIDISPRERVAGRLGLFGSAFSIGFVAGPVIGGLLAQPELGAAGFRPPLLAAAAGSALACLGVAALIREVRRPDEGGAGRPGLLATLRHAGSDPVLRNLLGSTFVSFAAFSAMWSTLGLWGAARFDWGPREIGLVMAVTGVSAALSQGLFSGALVRLFGESRTVAIGLCCTGAALAAQAGAPAPLVAIVCLTAAVAGHGLTLPAMSSLVSRSASSETQGATLGANAATGSLARVAGPVIAGGLFSAVGLYAPVLFAAVGMLPAAWLAWRAGRRLRL